ncbi:MAG: zf-HC2 domain-containing protein [Chloroflexota bacterium]|nr:zf-HC2 domain-containing protein [Chloroflexota bacterium]
MNKIREITGNRRIDHLNEWRPLLSSYIDHRLEEPTRNHVARHVAECRECRLELAALRRTIGLLKGLPEVKTPRSFTISPAQAQALRPRPLYRAAQFAAAIAAIFLFITCAMDLSGAFNLAGNTIVGSGVDPTTGIPLVGTRVPTTCPPTGLACAQGGMGGQLITPDPTVATSVATSSAAVINFEAARVVEVILAVLVITLIAFAFALRPRAPTKLRT